MAPPNEPIGDDASQETPDWLVEGDLDSDDAMAWLEEIAAKYDPEFEKTTDDSEASDKTAAEAVEESVAAAEVDDSLPDWLTEEEPAPAPVAEATPQADDKDDDDDLPDWLRADEPAPQQAAASASDDDDELPDWLRGDEPAAIISSAGDDDDDDLPDWLKEEAPATTPAAASDDYEDDLAWLRQPMEAAAITEDEDGELPDWLKDEEPAAAPMASLGGAAEDTEGEDALSWLSEHVVEQGVSPDEVVSEALTVDTPPTTPVTTPPPADAEAEAVSDDELPDWLKEAGGTEAMAEALSQPPSEFDLEDIPELDAEEDELAWLADTLEAESEKADDDLAALFSQLAEEDSEPVSVAAPEAEEKVEEAEEALPAWLMDEPAPAAAPEVEEAAEEEKEEELPAWLTEAEAAPPAPGVTDWLRSPQPAVEEEEAEEEAVAEAEPEPTPEPEPEPVLVVEVEKEEVEVEAEVEAEAEAEEEEEKVEVPAEEPEPVAAPAVAEPVPAPAPAPVAAQLVEIPEGLKGDFVGQFNIAREKLQAKAIDEALPLYENLISSGQMLDQTIADLEYAVQSAEKADPRLRRTLGDALRAAGRLQDALEAYRTALDEL